MTSKKKRVGIRRRREARSYRKLAVTMPADLADKVVREVRAKRAPSISALVSDAVSDKLERDYLQEVLDEVWKDKPMTAKERAWADKILGISRSTAAR